MTERGTALKKIADAAAPLYQSLDDGQKRRFKMLARLDRPRAGHHRHHWRHHGGRGMQQGSAGTEQGEQQKPQ